MIDHPRLTRTDAGEWAIELSVASTMEYNFAQPERETFTLSTRAGGLVVDDLEYEEREEIASVTARTVVLTGGLSVPDEKVDPVDIVQRIQHLDGGKHPTTSEIERLAEYLRTMEIEQDARWIVEELVEETRLSNVMSTEEIRTKRERMNDLRGIAKDL